MDNKLSELSKPVQIFKHPAGRNFWQVSADSNAGQQDVEAFYSQEYVSALLEELEASKKSNAFLKEQLAKLANFNPDWDMLEACRESWREVTDALKEAEAKLEAKDKRIAELEASETQLIQERDSAEQALADMYEAATGERPEWSNWFGFADAIEDVAQVRAKLATPVRLTDERTLWAGEDDYDTGHVKGWNANRIEQAALLKKQGFKVEGGGE